MTSLNQFVQMKRDIDEKLRREGLDIVKRSIKNLFKKYPKLQAIRWNGWAPHFNDGEACIFHLRHFYVNFGDVSVKSDFLDFEDDGYRGYGVFTEHEEFADDKELVDDLQDIWSAFNGIEDFFAWQFDHDFEATAYRDKDDIEIERAPDHD